MHEIIFLGESIYTLLNKLKAVEADSRNHIPIIVNSTSATSTIEHIFKIEFAGYLLKPIDINKLVVMIEKLVTITKVNIIGKNNYGLIRKIRTLMSPQKREIPAIAFTSNAESSCIYISKILWRSS
ncbi:MAG TPA: hypothetical protein DEF48_05320 [Nostoc sp. UBA8866]|nr:hypothetical protein DSM107007_37250 [Nostoc sp. PCC 7120 = FACHB-418]HBW29506.1 hypothetical protein [Nostoc sp. UBA8866]